MTNLPVVITKFIPYVPVELDEHLDFEPETVESGAEDHRFTEIIDGVEVPLNHHVRVIYENGITQCEGTYLDGYKEGIWRFFNENGVLSSVGSYNKKNQRCES